MPGFSTYRMYSIAAFLVWAVAFPVVALLAPDHMANLALVALGWAIAWVTSSIARYRDWVDRGKDRPFTYRAYTIGAFLVWGLILLVAALAFSPEHDQHLIVVFLGWAIGWLSTTIARSVYPPPGHTPKVPPATR
jgi:hypothetical protein